MISGVSPASSDSLPGAERPEEEAGEGCAWEERLEKRYCAPVRCHQQSGDTVLTDDGLTAAKPPRSTRMVLRQMGLEKPRRSGTRVSGTASGEEHQRARNGEAETQGRRNTCTAML